MAINTLSDWRMNGAPARQSILARPRRKDAARDPHGEDADEVQRSPATDHHIQTFFDALADGDAAEQSHALAKIIDAWRADNNAGGLPVYAHQPLPSAFANELAKVMQSNPEGKAEAEGVAARLQPGVRLFVRQQLHAAMDRNGLALSGFAVAQSEPHSEDADSPLRPTWPPQHPAMQTPADGRDHVGQLDERKSRPEPTQTHCKANADAWSDALGEYERLLDEIGRLQTERQAARELRKALDRDWEKRKTHSPTDQERMVEGSKLVQKESDLWRQEEAIRNQLRVLDQRKLDIWNRHKGCPDALPGDPNALAY